MFSPSKSYKKTVPMKISIGASGIDDVRDILATLKRKHYEPIRVKICHANSLTLSTSVVIRVIICALLEKSSSFFSDVSASVFPLPVVLATVDEGGGAEEATSLRTRVFANKIEFNWILIRT